MRSGDEAWDQWRAAFDRREPAAYAALTRLNAEIAVGWISKRHEWEKRPGPRYRKLPDGNGKLTEIEKDVLRALADGATARTASERLGKGIETVKTQLLIIKRKLNARTTTHAVAQAIRRGDI